MCKFILPLLIALVMGVPIKGMAQLESIENLEESTKKGFFKTYIKDQFKNFTNFGDPFAVSGGVGLGLRSYSAYGGLGRQDPFFYSLNANVNARVYKLDLPFSLLITAKNTESSLPNLGEIREAFRPNLEAQRDRFVRFGISPHYKWMRFHFGHRAMSFSSYTLSNLNFLGVGTELTPGNLRVAAMYGRLAQAEPFDLSLNTPNLPVYRRVGWGTKIGYGTEQSSIDLILFGAQDDPNSIDIPAESPYQPAPEENFVIGLNGQHLFFDRFRLRVEYALSALSPNRLDAPAERSPYPRFLFTERNTTEVHSAVNASLGYEGEAFTTGVQLKRVDPNYRTFGAYFFNNDIVDLVGNLAFGLWEGRINTQLSAGVQSNNLGLLKPSTTQRFIYSAALSFSEGNFSASADYSNNTTDIGYVLNPELDSLNVVLITQSGGVVLSYSLTGGAGNQHSFTLSGNVQDVTDDIEDPLQSATTQMLVGNFTYSYALSESKWRFSARTNYNQNELAMMRIQRYGFGGGITKSLLDNKMNVGVDANYFLNSNDMADNSSNLQGQVRWSYQMGGGLSANLNMGLLQTTTATQDPFTELTGNLGVQYNFSYTYKRKDKTSKKKDKAPKDEE